MNNFVHCKGAIFDQKWLKLYYVMYQFNFFKAFQFLALFSTFTFSIQFAKNFIFPQNVIMKIG